MKVRWWSCMCFPIFHPAVERNTNFRRVGGGGGGGGGFFNASPLWGSCDRLTMWEVTKVFLASASYTNRQYIDGCGKYCVLAIKRAMFYTKAIYMETRIRTVYTLVYDEKFSWFYCVLFGFCFITWWRHQTLKKIRATALCEGNLPVTSGFPSQRPVTRSFEVFFHLRLNKRINKQSRHWWFEPPSRSLWRHCNVIWYYGSALFIYTYSMTASSGDRRTITPK